jgi:hypothetical protein
MDTSGTSILSQASDAPACGESYSPEWSKNAASPVWSHGTLAAHAQRTTTRAPHLRCGVVGRTVIFPHRAARQLGHHSLWPGQNDKCHPASLAGSSAVAHRSVLSRTAGPRSIVPRPAVRFVVGLGSVVAKTAHPRRPAHDDITVTLHGPELGLLPPNAKYHASFAGISTASSPMPVQLPCNGTMIIASSAFLRLLACPGTRLPRRAQQS